MTMSKLSTCFSAITVMLIFLQNHLVASLSPIHQKTALFQFQQSLNITTPTYCNYFDSYWENYEIPSHPKTKNWSMSSDHCTWDGVSCEHGTGHVIGLDLSCSQLEGAILPNSTLFQLSHLRFLNLSNNDFSLSNQFPQELGSFAKGLTHLNLSFTGFSGRVPSGISHLHKLVSLDLGNIPASIGNLSMLESLDLSSNQLEGEIPHQLTSINTLERLNLSCNQLDGQIPKGPQFNTFDSDSYVGNIGLCGFPLSKECEADHIEMQKEGEDDDYFFSGFTWEAVVIGYGCGVVPAFIIGNLMLLAGKPKWFVGIIARELGLKVRRMEIRMR